MPLSVCDIFNDIDDKVWCFLKLVTDVMDINAPVKCQLISHLFLTWLDHSGVISITVIP